MLSVRVIDFQHCARAAHSLETIGPWTGGVTPLFSPLPTVGTQYHEVGCVLVGRSTSSYLLR